jgi:para-aminobenzoate synthetase component II
MIFLLDNYDSFAYNLAQYLGTLGAELLIRRNDQITVDEVRRLRPSAVVVSPGPCTPAEAGISVELIAALAGVCPVLGVCLGHQSLAAAFGGRVVRGREPVHGKVSSIRHDGRTLFRDVESPFDAARYHSLIVDRDSLPECLEVSAWTADGTVMGIRHKTLPMEGVQFHPESVLTGQGMKILRNFLSL